MGPVPFAGWFTGSLDTPLPFISEDLVCLWAFHIGLGSLCLFCSLGKFTGNTLAQSADHISSHGICGLAAVRIRCSNKTGTGAPACIVDHLHGEHFRSAL